MSARSRVSAKSAAPAPSKQRPGSANHSHRTRGTNLKPQSGDHRSSGHPLQPVPPGQARKGHGHGKKDAAAAAFDLKPFLVLGREELLSQLINMKKKQCTSETVINQLKAENQRYATLR